MDFEKICKERYSVRSFSDKKVEEEKISAILNLVRLAPTAKNNQPYEVYVVSSEKGLEEMKSARANCYNAQLIFAVCADEEKAWKNFYSGENSTLQDVGIIATTIMYGAKEYGLEGIYICMFDPSKFAEVFDLPENLSPKCLVAVGYPAEDAAPSERHFQRREIEEFVHRV